ncbi:MAG: twin-arginine translocase subunit TatC [Pseudomonadota bacterium]|nr:twin-arginine translocase subunit TatC [Pseudomonadota bacterium]
MSAADAGPGEQSLISHLLELRSRLLRAVLAVGLIFVALLPFSDGLYSRLAEPLLRSLPAGSQLIAIEVTSGFFVPMKLVFFLALLLSAPFVLYQLWAFVAPGLYQREKRLARPILVSATVLFYAGCAFTFFALLPVMFAYLASTAPAGVRMMTDIGHYLDFVLVMLLAGGISFEVPVAVMIAVILGWVTASQLSEWRGYVIVAIFIIAAILTPPDGLSQIMLAVPMCLLYELGVLMARLLRRRAEADARAG